MKTQRLAPTVVLAASLALTGPGSAEAGRGGASHRGHRGHGGHGGHGHHGGHYYGGGYYGGGYYGGPYYGSYRHGHYHSSGWGFGAGLALGALAAGVVAPRTAYVYGGGYGYPAYGYPLYAAPVYAAPVYSAPVYSAQVVYGSVDCEVRPRSAAVLVDGQVVGTAGDFDGWPSKLHLAPGTHTIEFQSPGYESARATVEVHPRASVQMRFDLKPAAAVEPYRLESVEEPRSVPSGATDREWNGEEVAAAPAPAPAPPADPAQAGILRLRVVPADASVYVDGRLAAGSERGGDYELLLSAGAHRIEVVKPGYDAFAGELQARARQTQELDVRLVQRGRS